MKKRVTSIMILVCIIASICSPVFATDGQPAANHTKTHDCNHVHEESNAQEVLPCGHVQTEQFLDSDECVQCFEERIIEIYGALPSPYGTLCPSCGGSYVSTVCAQSNIIDYNNYQEGEDYLCDGCAYNTCNSPCYVLQYLSYSRLKCNVCKYESYVFNSTGSGLARHYCGVYDYCSGNKYYRYCDLRGDRYEP